MNSSELKGFLTGLMFGDGYIDKGVTRRSFRIKSIKKDFIDYIYNELSSCTNFEIRIDHVDSYVSNGCNHKEYWELSIRSHPYFAKKYHHFYDDYKHRTLSDEALQWITPAGIANWYMSDGYVCLVGRERGDIYSRRIEFCTDRYSHVTVQKISKMLFARFGIQNSIIKRNNRYRIRIKSESYLNFINLIKPYVVESMRYKLFLGYTRQPKWMPDSMWNEQIILGSATA